MRDDLFEGIIIGATIGLVVVAIRVLFDGGAALGQVLALVLASIGLCCGQIVLSWRRVRRETRPPEPQQAPPRLAPRGRLSRHNPFAQELTHNWTGLDDRLADESAAAPEVPQGPSDKST